MSQTPKVIGALNRRLVERLYECASIRRWNDQVRPVEFTELDKQAHKMIIAYALARFEQQHTGAEAVDWLRLIEGAIFELLHRVILTDIKPPVFHRMMREKGRELNNWVLANYEAAINQVGGGFAARFREYLLEEDSCRREKRILKAAHFLATQWEFNIIYRMCPFVYGVERIKGEIEDQIEDHYDLIGVQKLSLGRKTSDFVNLCGQLRFQRRWSQSPRIPETSVIGHMLTVAILSYLLLLGKGACPARRRNGFLAGLFHDLPEVLTRDITSPVKTAVEGLDEIIKEYENILLEQKLLPLIPHAWHKELKYYMDDEFSNKVQVEGELRLDVPADELDGPYNDDRFNPVDGELVKCCDSLAAFIEAAQSIEHGITSKHLQEGLRRLWGRYRNRVVAGVDVGAVFAQFVPEGFEPDEHPASRGAPG